MPKPTPTVDDLRRHAVARSLFTPTTLPRAIARLGFVQADPLRAPARAQDLTLRHRVAGYRAGDLERRYPRLAVEEDFFVNYGFVPRATHLLMHPPWAPRTPRQAWPEARRAQAREVLAHVRVQGEVHPRDVDLHFAHGKVLNWFGGSGNATTQLLDEMHHRGLLRVVRRQAGVRLYAPGVAAGAAPAPACTEGCEEATNVARRADGRDARAGDRMDIPGGGTPDALRGAGPRLAPDDVLDALVDIVVTTYAPLPLRSLSELVARLRHAVPQWEHLRAGALQRARSRLPHAVVDGVRWFWPAGENPGSRRHAPADRVRLLAPFDPVVWDRRRFEIFWGWAYRFEAYTPRTQRTRGHYALPLLWRDDVPGWANLAVVDGRLRVDVGWQAGRAPREPALHAALDDELQRMTVFLGLS